MRRRFRSERFSGESLCREGGDGEEERRGERRGGRERWTEKREGKMDMMRQKGKSKDYFKTPLLNGHGGRVQHHDVWLTRTLGGRVLI